MDTTTKPRCDDCGWWLDKRVDADERAHILAQHQKLCDGRR